jgi:hypothetical protein
VLAVDPFHAMASGLTRAFPCSSTRGGAHSSGHAVGTFLLEARSEALHQVPATRSGALLRLSSGGSTEKTSTGWS